MSVLIKGMEMPTECRVCAFQTYQFRTGVTYCLAAGPALAKEFKPIEFEGRPNWCPLIPVPPHGRLIDADALKPYRLNEHYKYRLVYDADEVGNAPTIIPEEEGET